MARPTASAIGLALLAALGWTGSAAGSGKKDPPTPANVLSHFGKLVGHGDFVWSAVYSPDGKFALSSGGPIKAPENPAAADLDLHLWELETGKEVRRFKGHKAMVTAVAFSPDGKRAVSASYDRTVRLWDVETGQEMRQFTGHKSAVVGVAFSPGGSFLLSAGGDGTARLWNAATGAEVRVFRGHDNAVSSVAFSPDGRRILTGSWDTTVRLWDVSTGQELHRLRGHKDLVTCVAFTPDGKRAVSGGGGLFKDGQFLPGTDYGLRLWDLESGKELLRMPLPDHPVRGVAVSPEGKRAVSGGEDKQIHIWDLATGKQLAAAGEKENRAYVVAIALSPDGTHALACAGKEVHIWRVADDSEAFKGPRPKVVDVETKKVAFDAHKEMIRAAALSPDGKLALTGGGGTQQDPRGNDHALTLWETDTFRVLRRLDGHTAPVQAIAFSRKGKFAVSAGDDETVRLWDVPTGKVTRTLTPKGIAVPLGQIHSLALTPDERHAITGGGRLLMWDIKTGAAVFAFKGQTGFVHSVAVSPNGGLLLTGSADGTARLFSLKTGGEVRLLRGHKDRVQQVVFSADGKRALTVSGWTAGKGVPQAGEDNTARLWDVATGKEVKRFPAAPSPLESGAISPDGKLVAAGSATGSVHVWSVASGAEVASFKGHRTAVGSVAFFPDGRRLLSASRDTTARIWQLPAP